MSSASMQIQATAEHVSLMVIGGGIAVPLQI